MAKTTQSEVQAQWRPALVPGRTVIQKLPLGSYLSQLQEPAIGLNGDALSIALHNAGTGPALDVEAALVPANIDMESLNDANVILAGEQRFLRFSLPQSLTSGNALIRQSLIARYWDLGGTRFETIVAVNFDPGTPGTVDEEGDTVGYMPDVSSFGLVSVRTLSDRQST